MARAFGSVRYDKRRRRWYVDVRPHGRIYTLHGVKLINEEMAQELLSTLRSNIIDLKLSPDAACAEYLPRPSNTVRSYLPAYIEQCRHETAQSRRTPKSLRTIERYTETHWQAVADVPVTLLGYAELEDWYNALIQGGLHPHTVSNILGAFRAYLAWLKRRGELRQVPDFPSLSRRRPQPQTITLAEQEAVLAAIPDDRRGIYLCLAELVIRPNEARALDIADYHWETRELVVAHAMKGDGNDAPRRGTKTGKTHLRTASERLHGWLCEHVPPLVRRNPEVPLFRNPRGEREALGRWTQSSLWRSWRRACDSVGVDINLYNGTMHSTLYALRAGGVPLADLQEIRGHGSIETTRGYAPMDPARLREALRRDE